MTRLLAEDEVLVPRPIRGGGEPLEPATRADMEQAFGADLGSVRLHRGPEAARSAAAFQARAYTVGEDVVLGETSPERRTLAHELSHVLQQRAGPVEGRPIGGGVRVSDPADRFERAADASAERVVSGRPAASLAAGSPGLQRQELPEDEEEAVATLPLQRQEEREDEEEAVATLPLQRQEEPEDEEEAVATLPLQRQEEREDEEEAVATLPLQRQEEREDEEEAVATLPLQRQEEREDEEEAVATLPLQRQEEREDEEEAVATLPLQRQEEREDEEEAVATLPLQRQEEREDERVLSIQRVARWRWLKGRVREKLGGRSLAAEATAEARKSLESAKSVVSAAELVMPPRIAQAFAEVRGGLENVSGPIDTILNAREGAVAIFRFAEAVKSAADVDINKNPMAGARAFGRLFSTAGHLGSYLTPKGAPFRGYFDLLKNTGSFFERMAHHLTPSERWADKFEEYEREAPGASQFLRQPL